MYYFYPRYTVVSSKCESLEALFVGYDSAIVLLTQKTRKSDKEGLMQLFRSPPFLSCIDNQSAFLSAEKANSFIFQFLVKTAVVPRIGNIDNWEDDG